MHSFLFRALAVIATINALSVGDESAWAASAGGSETAPEVLVNYARVPIRIGAYSVIADFERELARRLRSCNPNAARAVEEDAAQGLLSRRTEQAIEAAVSCGITTDKTAKLTPAVWKAISNAPLPTLQDRIEALILTFEATDFGHKPEWNICQDGYTGRTAGQAAVCRNETDPCSLLTWGPRGATAGQGREIQWILQTAARVTPDMVSDAFGGEGPNFDRFLRLIPPPVDRCDGSSPLEAFMCEVWRDPQRRAVWEHALATLGRAPSVRNAFRDVYALAEFDGDKLKAYAGLWRAMGLPITEIDYAYFYDRATQIGFPPEHIAAELAQCVSGDAIARTKNAAARRCLSLLHPHPTLPVDRSARDVAFYKEAYPDGALTAREYELWNRHIPISAEATFSLSDARAAPLTATPAPAASISPPAFTSSDLTEQEKACPRETGMLRTR